MREYACFVGERFKLMETKLQTLLHAAVGCSGEAGELLDGIKKSWVYGRPLDRDNIIEEMGDNLFYIMAGCNTVGITLEQLMEANMEKLRKRYPDKYSDEAALLRADKNAPHD